MLKDHIAVRDYSRYNLVEPVVKPNNMTLEEVTSELGRASSDFYMHKMKNLDRMSARKREFMVKVVHIIATSSFLAGAMKGAMPEGMKKMLAALTGRLDTSARV
jgi:anaerobic magnesium-protoporphyrin IX monomethyl ester cyclase